MDGDIQFGELEEVVPQRQLRPDQNRHFAVVKYGAPAPEDLAIFVDIDVVRDMEAHAASNTGSELGGVLLGGQHVDDEGRPFVVITDSLRAEHYEATKGSFKFTHETWSDITRKREEFPDEIQMVGWYHTHPDWGVFLSGMDTFICDHFFNKPLDVALVIDPCQSQRAFFQWDVREGPQQTRATGGFHLTASHFRQPELEILKAQLEGTITMPSDPRFSGSPTSYPPTVVQLAEPRQTWLSIAVLGMLLLQFSVVALIAWRLLAPPDPQAVAATQARAAQLQAERELLDKIIGQLDVAPEGVAQSLEDARQENEQLRTVQLGLSEKIKRDTRVQELLEHERTRLANDREELLATLDDVKQQRGEYRERILTLKEQLAEYEDAEQDETVSVVWAWVERWKWLLSGCALVVLIALAAFYARYGPPEPEAPAAPEPPAASEEQP